MQNCLPPMGSAAMSARNDREIAMDFGLSEEQEMIVETVRDFVETEI